MKYKQSKKQNQRITRISDKTLVVGADIAKETHVARAIDYRGIELGKDCVFSNTRTGLEQLVQWMKELQQEHAKSDVLFGIGPTGHYWFTLAAYLGQQGISLVIVNPHHVHKSKELEDNSPTKSDYKDAKVIADLVRNVKYSEPKLLTNLHADLRILMNLREKIMVNLGQVTKTNAELAGSLFLLFRFIQLSSLVGYCFFGFFNNVTTKEVFPIELFASISPPCNLTILLAIASPRPDPPVYSERDFSTL